MESESEWRRVRTHLEDQPRQDHFFTSGQSGTVAADKRLVDALDAAGIAYYLHVS